MEKCKFPEKFEKTSTVYVRQNNIIKAIIKRCIKAPKYDGISKLSSLSVIFQILF